MKAILLFAVLLGTLFALTSGVPAELNQLHEGEEFDADTFRGAYLVVWSECDYQGDRTEVTETGCLDATDLHVGSYKVRKGYKVTWYDFYVCPKDQVIKIPSKCNTQYIPGSVKIKKK
ncbi:uncharacterized protein VTP21DRAFT_1157 [Calcarisporiella thermophila]|uniref:uncharacterized protein n=1 Tax=Calcarisporiella thermophila TaxID=911321 RepID=UPI0037449BB1